MLDETATRGLVRLLARLGCFAVWEGERAVAHLFEGMLELFDAHNAFIVVFAEIDGWKVIHRDRVRPNPPEVQRLYDAWLRDHDYRDDPALQAVIEQAGRHRVFRGPELVAPEVWERCATREVQRILRVSDRMVAVHALRPDLEVHVGVDRPEGAPPFGPGDRALAGLLMEGVRPVYARWLLTLGLLEGDRMLPLRHRVALGHLLRGASEKEAADAMGIAPSTVHQYVVAVYRHFGVRSRGELLSLWLDPPTVP